MGLACVRMPLAACGLLAAQTQAQPRARRNRLSGKEERWGSADNAFADYAADG